jgi:hypothetical protein
MSILYLDIEAVRDPSNPGKDREDGWLQAAPHWVIVAACAVVLTERNGHLQTPEGHTHDPPPFVDIPKRREDRGIWYEATQALEFGRGSTDERTILEHIADAFDRKPSLRTWAGDAFDLPVIRAAMMAHGVRCSWLFHYEVTNRYKDGHRDLMDELCNRGGAPRWSLGGTAIRMGLPGKIDGDGCKVQSLWDAGKCDEIRAYCMQDTWQLAAIDLRLELSSGKLTLDGYKRSAQSLGELAEKTPGLVPLLRHERFDRKRFLLEA